MKFKCSSCCRHDDGLSGSRAIPDQSGSIPEQSGSIQSGSLPDRSGNIAVLVPSWTNNSFLNLVTEADAGCRWLLHSFRRFHIYPLAAAASDSFGAAVTAAITAVVGMDCTGIHAEKSDRRFPLSYRRSPPEKTFDLRQYSARFPGICESKNYCMMLYISSRCVAAHP